MRTSEEKGRDGGKRHGNSPEKVEEAEEEAGEGKKRMCAEKKIEKKIDS